jgi:Flp pilus assembly protein TadD
MRTLILLLLFAAVTFQVQAGFSPKTDIEVYNQGVELLLKLKFKKAEKKFREAIELNESLGEAHNNLAYCLRKQGAENYGEAMSHYNRAIELIPEAAEPYMYRGVLYVSMGRPEAALRDHMQLTVLGNEKLAAELKWVIENNREKDPEQFFGVFPEL